MNETRLRKVLKAGSLVFGFSAIVLLIWPALFNQLLSLPTSAALEWAMRMIGVTLIALSGNMFSVSTRGTKESVLLSGRVMIVSAAALGVLTLLIPAELSWFTIGYAAVGFSFSAAYLWAFFSKK